VEYIAAVLEQRQGRSSRAARALGIQRTISFERAVAGGRAPPTREAVRPAPAGRREVTHVKIPAAAAAVVLLLIGSSVASAQQQLPPPPDAETGVTRVRLGPFWLNPSMALRDAGIDTNVFNDAEDQNPKSDFTFTVTPQTDVWLRMGRTWLGGVVKEDIVYYREFASERATNESYAVGWVAPLSRVHFDAEANWADRRDRVGYEIDARLQHTDFGYRGSGEVRALAKTFVGVKAAKGEVDYSEDSYYRGESVREQLNRHETEIDLTLRYQLTPLTSLLFEGGRQEDRFDYEPLAIPIRCATPLA